MESQNGWQLSTASLCREAAEAQANKGGGLWYSLCLQSVNINTYYSSSQRMYLRTTQTTTLIVLFSGSLSAFIVTPFLYFKMKGNWNRRFHIVCQVLAISCLTHCSFKPVINQAEVLQFIGFSEVCTSCKVTDWFTVSRQKKLTRHHPASWLCPAYFVCMSV